VADESRIEALKRRLQKDPGSIAFAQLAEEYRRAGRFRDAIDACRSGLAMHPGYLSARVTLGRALIETGDAEAGERELKQVLRAAPDNLSAIRALAEIHSRTNDEPETLAQFRSAFDLAGADPAVDQMVRDLRRSALTEAAWPGSPGEVPPAAGAGSAAPGRAEGVSPAAADDLRAARRTLAYLERWLQAILADRRARLYANQT
jgi:tetratricopeptide (TPR) repeat protein